MDTDKKCCPSRCLLFRSMQWHETKEEKRMLITKEVTDGRDAYLVVFNGMLSLKVWTHTRFLNQISQGLQCTHPLPSTHLFLGFPCLWTCQLWHGADVMPWITHLGADLHEQELWEVSSGAAPASPVSCIKLRSLCLLCCCCQCLVP